MMITLRLVEAPPFRCLVAKVILGRVGRPTHSPGTGKLLGFWPAGLGFRSDTSIGNCRLLTGG